MAAHRRRPPPPPARPVSPSRCPQEAAPRQGSPARPGQEAMYAQARNRFGRARRRADGGLAACGPEESDPRHEALTRGSAMLIARGVVPKVGGLRSASARSDDDARGLALGGPIAGPLRDLGNSLADGGDLPVQGVGSPAIAGGGGVALHGDGELSNPSLSGGVARSSSVGGGGVAGGPVLTTGGGGPGTGLARSLCGFMGALCDKIVECNADRGSAADECSLFSTGQCPAAVDQALSAAGGDVPAITCRTAPAEGSVASNVATSNRSCTEPRVSAPRAVCPRRSTPCPA